MMVAAGHRKVGLVLHCWRGLSFCHHQPRSPARGHHRQPQSEKFNIQIFQTNKQTLSVSVTNQ